MALTVAERSKRYRQRHPDRVRAASKRNNARYYAKHRDRLAEKQKEYERRRREDNPEALRKKHKSWRDRNSERVKESSKRYSRKLRDTVISGYGGSCACCGESRYEFLALDHVHENGAEERRRMNGNRAVYVKAIRDGFPDCYRLLCHNCNAAIYMYGRCPHQSECAGVST